MYSRIPTATFDTKRSPVRTQGRSPSNSPGKSPAGTPKQAESGLKGRGQSPGRSGQNLGQRSRSDQSPDVSPTRPSQGHGSRTGQSPDVSPTRPSQGHRSRIGQSPEVSPTRPGLGKSTDNMGKAKGQKSPGKSPGKPTGKSPTKSPAKAPESGGQSKPGGRAAPQAGVRYITDEMIRKMSKQDNFAMITTLNLTLSKEGGGKIKYIENLEQLKKLQNLNLSCNMIEKIEKLDKLTRLQELNLSYNNLSRLDGIENLTGLQVLSVTGNNITQIPLWLSKKLKGLRVLKLAKNNIQSIEELTKLRPLKDLTQLTVAENPVSQLSHCRAFLVFHLRTLDSIDAQPITTQERTSAHNRFAQEELEKLEKRLEEQTQKYQKLHEEHNKSLGEVEHKGHKVREFEQKIKQNHHQIHSLEHELMTKNDLLKRKTSELTKACQKHYELEQELAFYKIDHKFDELARPQMLTSDSENNMSADDGLVGGESPYLGKGRFKKNEYIRQKRMQQQQQMQHQQALDFPDAAKVAEAREKQAALERDLETRVQMNETLDKDLDEKHEAIEHAQEKLRMLQTELQLTEDHLRQATDELHRISEAAPARSLTEDDKEDINNILARKITKVKHLRGEASKIEDEMQRAQHDLDRQEQEVTKLRGKLKRMGSRDSLYNLVKKEVADKEHQLEITAQEYADLQRQLESMLHTIARETEDIKKLEHDLRDGQVTRNDELRQELEGIIKGLQDYLSEVQNKAETQKAEYDNLFKQKLQLVEQLKDKDRELEMMDVQADELSNLREKIAALEDSLQVEQEENDSLRHQVDESRIREQGEADMSVRLHEAEDQLTKLKRALKDTEKKAQAEKENNERKMDAEQKKISHLKNKAREANLKEDEIRNLHNQLTNLQMTNAGLQDEIYKLQGNLKEEQNKAVNPDNLRQRLADMTRALGAGGRLKDVAGQRGRRHDDAATDPVEEVLGEIQDHLQHELDKSFKEVERAKHDRDTAETEVIKLKEKMTQVQETEREMAEQAIQAMMDEEHEETERLRRQLDRLKAELAREREINKERDSIPTRLLEPSQTSHTRSATTATTRTTGTTSVTTAASVTTATESSEEETSTIPSSQWSQKKRELYDNMTPEEQDLFDELQREIEELRKLLMMKGKGQDAVKKATEAVQTAAMLRDMLEARPSESGGGRRGTRDTHSAGVGGSGDRSIHQGASHSTRTPRGDTLTKAALEELERCTSEIEELQQQLHVKNKQIKDGLIRTDRSDYNAAAQQEEIEQLHAVLQEQKGEIHHLNKVIDDVIRPPGGPTRYRDQLDQMPQGRGVPLGPEQYATRAHEADLQRSPGKHRSRGPREHEPGFVDRRGRPLPAEELDGYFGGRATIPRGRPVPAFYSPDGQQIPFPDDDYYTQQGAAPYSRAPGYHQMAPGLDGQPIGQAPYPMNLQGMPTSGQVPGSTNIAPGMTSGNTMIPGMASGQGISMASGMAPGMGAGVVPSMAHGITTGMGPGVVPAGHSQNMMNQHLPGTQIPGTSAPGMNPIGGQSANMGGLPGVGSQQAMANPNQMFTFDAQGNVIPNPQMGMSIGGMPSQNMMPSQGAMGVQNAGLMPSGMNGVASNFDHGFGQQIANSGVGMYPTTPQGQSGLLPTTPIAGSGMGHVLSGPNTPAGAVVQPMMMSTPMAQGAGSVPGSPLKGILKKGGAGGDSEVDLDQGLLCSVPEHHDLEDYVSQLQAKIRSLKGKLRDGQESAAEDSKRVIFEEDVERETIHRLQDELEERRRDLESLDLAIERQKSHLTKMKKKERALNSRRKSAKEELSILQGKPRATSSQRQAFLDGDLDLSISDSDFDYEYEPHSGYRGRKDYVQQEISCLEATLAKRRAELRAADKLLNECQMDLSDARYQAQDTIANYQTAREGVRNTLQDAQVIEERTREAGVQLVRTEEELEHAKAQLMEVTDEREQQQAMLSEIQKIISSKDAEFQNLDAKIKQASHRLQEVQFELHSAEGQLKEHLSLLKESDKLVSDKRHDLEHLQKQLYTEKQQLDLISKQVSHEKAELEMIQDVTRTKKSQLDFLTKDIALEVENKRKDAKGVDTHLDELRQERQQLDLDLQKAQNNLEHEEAVLQNVATMTSQKKQELHSAEDSLKTTSEQLKSFITEHDQANSKLIIIKSKLVEEEAEFDRLRTEGRKRAAEVDSLHRKTSALRDELDSLQSQKRSLEGTINGLQKEKNVLEDNTKEVQRRFAEVKRAHAQVEGTLHADQHKLTGLDQELKRVETILDYATKEHGSVNGELDGLRSALLDIQGDVRDGESDLRTTQQKVRDFQNQSDQLNNELNGRKAELQLVSEQIEQLKDERERLGHKESKFLSLEDKLKNLGHEIVRRDQEKTQLTSALDKSHGELTELKAQFKQERDDMGRRLRQLEGETRHYKQDVEDRNKELQHLRNKTANEIADLESIAQTHCCRANRLSDELSYMRAEYMEVKRQLDSQQEIAEREKKLEDTLKDLKCDIKYEVADSLLDQQKSKEDSLNRLAQLQDQSSAFTDNLTTLKQSLSLIRSEDSGFQNSTDSLKESVLEHQNFLKNQLSKKMERQAELLQAQRQISQDNLLSLQRKLSTLEQVFLQADCRALSDSTRSRHDKSADLIVSTDEEKSSSQESSKEVPKRAYSPHRYSNHRSPKPAGASILPEKDSSLSS